MDVVLCIARNAQGRVLLKSFPLTFLLDPRTSLRVLLVTQECGLTNQVSSEEQLSEQLARLQAVLTLPDYWCLLGGLWLCTALAGHEDLLLGRTKSACGCCRGSHCFLDCGLWGHLLLDFGEHLFVGLFKG